MIKENIRPSCAIFTTGLQVTLVIFGGREGVGGAGGGTAPVGAMLVTLGPK